MGLQFVLSITFLILMLENPLQNHSKALILLFLMVLKRVKTDKYEGISNRFRFASNWNFLIFFFIFMKIPLKKKREKKSHVTKIYKTIIFAPKSFVIVLYIYLFLRNGIFVKNVKIYLKFLIGCKFKSAGNVFRFIRFHPFQNH